MNKDRRRWLAACLLPLVVFLLYFAPAAAQKGAGEQAKLDLNIATAEELDRLPEVGPKLAAAIVQFREKAGRFRRVEELLAVPGITRRRLEKIRPHVMVHPQQSNRPA